jgi:hypothetical protein
MRHIRRHEFLVKIIVIILTIIAYVYIQVTYPLDFVDDVGNTNVAPTPEYFDTSTSNPPIIINDTIKKPIKKYNPSPYPDSNYILRPYNRYPNKIKSNRFLESKKDVSSFEKSSGSEYKVILASDKQSDDRINEKKERRNAFIKFVLSVLLLIILVYIIIPLIIV